MVETQNCWKVYKAENGVHYPWQLKLEYDFNLIVAPVFVSQWLYKVWLEQFFEVLEYQERSKVEEALFIMNKPTNVHDLHFNWFAHFYKFTFSEF